MNGRAALVLVAGCLCTGCSSSAERDAASGPQPSATSEPRPVAAPAPGPARPTPEQLAALRAAVESSPDDPAARRRLAIALHEALERDEAVAQFEKAAELGPDARSLLDLALAYGSVSRLADAESTYARLLALAPDHAVALHNLGNIYLKRGETERAIASYRKAIAAQPRYVLAHYHLADALERAEQFREAYETFGRVLELEPSDPQELAAYDDSLYRMAALDIRMGEYERAGTMLEALLAENPAHPSAHYAYGQVLLQLGRLEEARAALERHMKLLSQRELAGPVATGE
jgi:tetratricopeptide (TPR) repeat protein